MGCAPSKDEAQGGSDAMQHKGMIHRFMRHERPKKSQVQEAVDEGKFSLMNGYESDKRCPVSARQLYSVTKSWKAINRDITLTSINMFVRLFESNQDIQEFFVQFKDIETVSDLRSSKVFEEHATMVVSTIDEVVANLDDMDYVLSMLTAIGEAHSVRFKNFKATNFSKLEEPFLLAVKETLGDRFTISIETIYRTMVRFIIETLANSFTAHRTRTTAIESTLANGKDEITSTAEEKESSDKKESGEDEKGRND